MSDFQLPDTEMSIPESVMSSILDKWGYKDSEASTEPAPETEPIESVTEPVIEPIVEELPEFEPASSTATEDDELAPIEDALDQLITPPTPPGGPIFPEESVASVPAPQGVTIGGRTFTPSELEALATLDSHIRSDPRFREGVSNLLSGTQSPSAAPVLRPIAQSPLPNLTEEDLQDPAVRYMASIAVAQHNKMAEMEALLNQTRAAQQQTQLKETAEVANAASSNFQRQYNLPDELMTRVRANVSEADLSMYLNQGIHPQTRQPVAPDGYRAAEAALERAYWNTPEARQFEFERQSTNQAKALSRKQRLAAIGGTSGSSPRTPPPADISTQEGRRAAAIQEVSRAMFGEQ